MINSCKVLKLNPEFSAARNVLKASGIDFDEAIKDKSIVNAIKKEIGIDLSEIDLKDSYLLKLDINKVLAVGEVENVPAMDGVKGFAIWFSPKPEDCWYLDPSCYLEVCNKFENKI